MKLYAEITKDVDSSPAGKSVGAFFDMDGTLLSGFTVTSFFLERVRTGKISPSAAIEQFVSLLGHKLSGREYTELLKEAAESLKGSAEQQFIELGEQVFRKYVAGAIYPESRALIRAHQAKGHTVAIISSATRYQIDPVARELGVEHIMCNHFGVTDGKFSGSLEEPICYGRGKLTAAESFAKKRRISLKNSYFYSDGGEDIPLLDAVGHPRPMNPDSLLTRTSQSRDWPIRRFDSRGIPGPKEFVRTGLAYGAFITSALTILPTWLLNRSRREAVNLATTVWGEFGTALAGVKLKTTGEQHLWSSRPAVFVFNHQSALDAPIIARLLRRDFTGIAKSELINHPIAGPMFRVADTVFVDRRDPKKAVAALKPVVATLQQGLSIAVAPEGTRSSGDRLGPFKKGPFHIAMQAGVPVVPIVIHNATDALPKSGIFVRPSTVYVDVLPPVSTDEWHADTVDEHVAEVRQLFLTALGQE